VQDKHSEELGDQYLTYAGKQLDDSRAIADYGIGQGCTLELSSRLLGGCHYCHCSVIYRTSCNSSPVQWGPPSLGVVP
jgi:hypothetical protein